MFLARLARQLALIEQRMNEDLLRIDIAYVLAAGDQEGFTEGWPFLRVNPARLAASCQESNKPIEELR